MAQLSIAAFLACKGKRQITQTFTQNPLEAKACNEAGIDVIVTMADSVPKIRKAAPDVMVIGAANFTEMAASNESAIRAALDTMGKGADGIYCGAHNMDRVKALADAAVPVIGHVGLVPYRASWTGGMRAVGKTLEQAEMIYERTMAYEAAGAIAVEMEVVPEAVAAEITKQTQMIVISMGAGSGCDGQYLFTEDMFGTNGGHVPRHAKQYCDLQPIYEQLHSTMVDAIRAFRSDVDNGGYPAAGHVVQGNAEVNAAFAQYLQGKQQP